MTGGAGGIGRQLAEHLTREYRAQVILCGRRSAADVGVAHYVSCNVSDESQVVALAETIHERYGRLDGLLHAAGVLDTELMALRSKSWDSIRAVWAPKLEGSVYLIKHVVERFVPSKSCSSARSAVCRAP